MNPFASQALFWFDFEGLRIFFESGIKSLIHMHWLLKRYPDAMLYYRSRPLIRDTTSAYPPALDVSQFGGAIEACHNMYRRYTVAMMQRNASMPALLHAQLCMDDPDACIIVHDRDSIMEKSAPNLAQLVSHRGHKPATWNQLTVCTLVRNKNEYLPEWIEFHRIQGFDHFIIYDDASRNPSLFLDSYIEDGIVTLIDWSTVCANVTRPLEIHGFAGCQRAAFADCQRRVVSRWLGIFDVDEFLFAPPATNASVLGVLQDQPHDIAGFKFVGAVFGNGNRTYPDVPKNKEDILLVTNRYTLRQPVKSEEGALDGHGAHLRAHKEIARLKCVTPDQHGIHNFIYGGCSNAHTVEFHASNTEASLRMHHYQYLSVFQSHLKAQLNGNLHVAISDPVENAAYNLVEDKVAGGFSEVIRTTLAEKDARSADGVLPRGITLVLTSIGRIDLLNRTLETFRRHNTYPIARGIITEDSGQAGIIDFVPDMLDFPIEIIYTADLNEQRRHKVGMLGLIDCVDKAYGRVETEFIFHMEDDWEFTAPGFIERSIDILDTDPTLIQVWLRAHNDNHPVLPTPHQTIRNRTYYMMDPEYGEWHGFSFNPRLRRLHDYKVIGKTFFEATKPHRQQIAGELDVNLLYYRLGYRAATTDNADGFIRHIGGGRTTDPGCSHGC